MTGIVVIAHAPLATALGECVEHVYSCEPGVTRREVRLLDVSPSEKSRKRWRAPARSCGRSTPASACSC